ISWQGHGDGTATVSWAGDTPAGQYLLCLTASNGVAPDATQTLTIDALAPPAFTSSPSASFPVGPPGGSFTVRTSPGYPAGTSITFAQCGGDFAGSHISWQDNGDGTATVSWAGDTPAGQYVLCLTASNGVAPDATQTLTIDAMGPPEFTSPASVSFRVGPPGGSFTVRTLPGYPAGTSITFAQCGGDFAGSHISWQDNGDGTATVSWTKNTPAGSYQLCLTASNGVSPDATQTLTISFGTVPSIAIAPPRPRIDLRAGDHSVVPLVVGGIPDPTLSITSGALPDGLVLDGGSTAIVGQPSPTDLGDHVVTITATNAVGSASVTVDLYVVAPGG
ncbi:MAG: putative Ig domain-containing protein, partial [Actinomycetota bacterium]|nr:putative Ig domain-containing protein [Actinomycetota bacterium]